MQVRRAFWAAAFVAGALWFVPRTVSAGAGYQCSITEEESNPTSTHLAGKESDAIVIKPSKKKGDGGATFQLKMKNVTCSQCNNNVLDTSVHALGQDIDHTAGILFNITGGKAVFPSTGKDKTSGGKVFGSLVSVIFGHPLGFGVLALRGPASDPAACNTVPLLPGNQCTDGAIYAIAGFKFPVDESLKCNGDDNNCGATQICGASGFCETQQCTADGECKAGAKCDLTMGTCCVPGVGTCPQ